MIDPADQTLDELRVTLAPAIARNAAFDGWRAPALAAAERELGLPAGRGALVFETPVAMIDAWFAYVDRAMATACRPEQIGALKMRERIATLVIARLDLLAPQKEALRRALAVLALPPNVGVVGRLGWRAADSIWRLAGDTATDLNHYTKRVTLAAVYSATLMAFLEDESENFADTRAFLARRIDGVMRFEKAKARFKPDSDRMFSFARLLGRLRYPAV